MRSRVHFSGAGDAVVVGRCAQGFIQKTRYLIPLSSSTMPATPGSRQINLHTHHISLKYILCTNHISTPYSHQTQCNKFIIHQVPPLTPLRCAPGVYNVPRNADPHSCRHASQSYPIPTNPPIAMKSSNFFRGTRGILPPKPPQNRSATS